LDQVGRLAAVPTHPVLTPTTPLLLLLGEFGEIPVKSIRSRQPSSSPRIACRNRVRRRARLCPPTVHNEQSLCRDTVSLLAWWRLPGASGLAPLLCDNTWQVAVPMTSNPKAVHNGQGSSPKFPCILGQRDPRVSAVKSLPKTRAPTARPFTNLAQDQNTRMVLRRSVCTGEVLRCGCSDRLRTLAAPYN
jgi:hypothetical protein